MSLLRLCAALRNFPEASRALPGASLRWINARATNSNQNANMVIYRQQRDPQATEPAKAMHLPALAERHDLMAVPAAWPVGASQLAIAHDVVRRHNDVEVRSDWVAPARAAD